MLAPGLDYIYMEDFFCFSCFCFVLSISICSFLCLVSCSFVSLLYHDYYFSFGGEQLGPEGTVINELEGRAPQKIIADVCLTCEEEFSLEDENGKVVHTTASQEPKVKFDPDSLHLWSSFESAWRLRA